MSRFIVAFADGPLRGTGDRYINARPAEGLVIEIDGEEYELVQFKFTVTVEQGVMDVWTARYRPS